jgi:hypothetical protein
MRASKPCHPTGTPAILGKDDSPGRAPAPSLSCPAWGGWDGCKCLIPNPRRCPDSPSFLPRKAEGFPSGPDTPWHRWCSWLCRAYLGAPGERLLGCSDPGRSSGWRGPRRTGAALAPKCHTRARCPGRGTSAGPPGLWSPRSRRLRYGSGPRARAAGSERPRGVYRGFQAARPPGEGARSRGGRRARRTSGSSPPGPRSTWRPASPSKVCGGGQSRCAGGRARRTRSHTPRSGTLARARRFSVRASWGTQPPRERVA